jgi:hypothetical protein
MEIKIIISDIGGAAEARAASQPQVSVERGATGGGMSLSGGAMHEAPAAASATGASVPPEVLRQAEAIGAFDGGPAPSLPGPAQPGAPQPFIAARAAQVLSGATMGGAAAPESAGAAPGSGPAIDTTTTDDGGRP